MMSGQPLDPNEAAKRGARPHLRKRFYKDARIAIVDATRPIEEVGARILDALKERSWIS